MEDKASFIAKARREQIIAAAIEALDEIGYVKISLAQIARKAKISTGLISYHFSDKEDLLQSTLHYLLQAQYSYILQRTPESGKAQDQLIAFIDASLAYQAAYSSRITALVEIIFNARTPDNVPFYKLADDGDDPLHERLQQILRYGQSRGEFAAFHVGHVATMLQGAVAEAMITLGDAAVLDGYRQELLAMAIKMVRA